MYQLEERILFDGAAAADIAAAQHDQQAQDTQAQAQPQADASQATDSAHAAQAPAPILHTDSAPAVQDTAIAADATPVAAAIDPASAPTAPDAHHVNVLVVSESLENADSLSQSANSDTIVVKYDPKTMTGTELLHQISDALNGEKADSIGFVTDKSHDGAISIFSNSDTSNKTISTAAQKNFWDGVEGLLAEKGKVNIFASDLASTANGRHLVDSISKITNHQVAASTDVTGDPDAGGNWELEYVAKGSGSVNLIDQYFDHDSIQSFDHRIEDPTEIAFIDTSVVDAKTIVSQLDKDVEIVYLSKDNALNDITDYLKGRTDVDSISIISDADYTTGGFFLGKDVVNADYVSTHHDALAAWGKSMSADGDIHIYGCNVAKDLIGKDLVNQIASITGADVAASTDITGLAGNWNLEYSTGSIETQDFVINDYYHNLNTLTVRRLDDYVLGSNNSINPANLTLREAIAVANDGDSIVFADYTVLHSSASTTPDIQPWFNGHVFMSSYVYHLVDKDSGFVSNGGFDLPIGTASVTVTGFTGAIAVNSYIQLAGDPTWHHVSASTVGAGGSGTLTFETGLLNLVHDGAKITSKISTPGLADTLTVSHNITINGAIEIPAWDDNTTTPITHHDIGGYNVILDARDLFRVFYIDSARSPDGSGVSLLNMNIQNGRTLTTDVVNAAGQGGGIYITNRSTLTLDGSVIVGNKGGAANGNVAQEGGGVYNAGILHSAALIVNNRASQGGTGNGGGIYNVGNLYLTSQGQGTGEVYNNFAAGLGGGIYNNGIMDSTGSSAAPFEVGWHWNGVKYVVGTNSANGHGGGIYSNNGYITMSYTDVGNNIAGQNGGGIYIFSNYEQPHPIHFFSVNLLANWANIDGGGFYMTNGNSAATAYVLEWEASVIGAPMLGNGAGRNGGGICLYNNTGNIFIATVTTAGSSSSIESTIQSNGAVNGGAVYIENCNNVKLDFLAFSGNSASANGGAICVIDSGNITLSDLDIQGNSAVWGGGVYYSNVTSGTLNIKTSDISNNFASGAFDPADGLWKNGAGIFMANGNLSIENCTFAYNGSDNTTVGGAIYMDYGNLTINFSTLAYNRGIGSAIYVTGSAIPANKTVLVVTNSIIYNLDADFLANTASQIYIPVAAQIDTTGFSNTTNIYSHYYLDLQNNPVGNSLTLANVDANRLIGYDSTALPGNEGDKSILIESNLWLDQNLMYHANYRTMALAILSQNSWAWNTVTATVAYDQRGNSRTGGFAWNGTAWVTGLKTKATIGAFDPIFHTEVNDNGDDSGLWYTADDNAHYYATSSANGLTLREAIYWIDTRTQLDSASGFYYTDPTGGTNNFVLADYQLRYVGFNSSYFAAPSASVNPHNTIQLTYGEIENGGRWGNWDSLSGANRDVAVGYLVRNPDNSGNIIAHDNTLRGPNDPNRITVIGGTANSGIVLGYGGISGRLFVNPVGSSLAINNLTLKDGVAARTYYFNPMVDPFAAYGGGIDNDPGTSLTLVNVSIVNCYAEGSDGMPGDPKGGRGGALWNGGTAYIYDSQMLDNTVKCIIVDPPEPADSITGTGWGGGIYNGGTMIIDRTRINGNKAFGATDVGFAMLGGGLFNFGTLTIERSEITENTVTGFANQGNAVKGAGFFNVGTAYMANCTVAENILDTTGIVIAYGKNDPANPGPNAPYVWGASGSGIYNYAGSDLTVYYTTIYKNQSLVKDPAFWDPINNRASNLDSFGALYNESGSPLHLSNSILAENMVIFTGVPSGTNDVYQRADIYVANVADVDTTGDNGRYNIIGAFNAPMIVEHYSYAPIDPLTTPVQYYELSYSGGNAVWTAVYEYVATLTSTQNTGFDWSAAGLNNQTGFSDVIDQANAPMSYITVNNPTTSDNIPVSLQSWPYSLLSQTPFIYTAEKDATTGVLTGRELRVDASGAFVFFDPTKVNALLLAPEGLYTTIDNNAVAPTYTYLLANNNFATYIYSLTTPKDLTRITSGTGKVADTSDPRYGLITGLNLEDTLNYNGAMTRSYRVLTSSKAMDTGTLLANPGAFFNLGTDQRGVDRLVNPLNPGVTNIGSFDYLTASIVVRSGADSSAPRNGFDYTDYKPLWESSTLTLREAVNIADDGSDITFKSGWRINGTPDIAIPGGEVVNELDSSGNLIINLVGGELLASRSITLDGMYSWIDQDSVVHTGGITQLVATPNSRIFDIKSAVINTLSTVSISNMSMSSANVIGNGGGIYSSANLTLDNVLIENCTATTGASGTDGLGGGIYSNQGSLTIRASQIIGNTAVNGGGIYVTGSSGLAGFVLDISGSSILNNIAQNASSTDGVGGGIYLLSGNSQITYSTISGNKAVSDGGGIYIAATGPAAAGSMTLINSTISNNTAGRNGGGISFFSQSNLNLDFVTLANNQSGWTVLGAASGHPFAFGGGIYMNCGTLQMSNSILAQNFRGEFDQDAGVHEDLYLLSGTANLSYSVYGATGGFGTINNVGGTSFQVPDWAAFKGKLDTQTINNGGKTNTVYVLDGAYFQIADPANAVQVDQTMLDMWANRTTVGSLEKVSKVLYYIGGEIGKGNDGGSTWVSSNGVYLTETAGVLTSVDTTFVFQNGVAINELFYLDYSAPLDLNTGYLVATGPVPFVTSGDATLNYDWDLKNPIYGSSILLSVNANLTVSAGVAIGGKISITCGAGDASTLDLQTSVLKTTANTSLVLSIHSTGISDNTVIYSSVSPTQTVFTVDENSVSNTYDNLNLYGKDRGIAVLADLSTKNAAGTLNVLGDITVGKVVLGNLRDNVKLNVTTAGANPGDLNFSGAIHDNGQINVQRNMTDSSVGIIAIDGISGFSTITAGNMTLSDFTMDNINTVTVNAGDLTMTNGTLTGVTTFNVSSGDMTVTNSTITGTSTVTVSGIMTMLTNSTINGAPTLTVNAGILAMTDSTINSASTLTGTITGNLDMDNSTINGTDTKLTVTGNLTMVNNSTIQFASRIAVGDLSHVSNLQMTNSTINANNASITASGDMLMTTSIFDGGAGATIATISGNVTLVGAVDIMNATIRAGSNKTVFFGDGTATTVTLTGATLGSSVNSAVFQNNSYIVANGSNNQILSKGLTVNSWTTGTITVNALGALKVNIGSQNLQLSDATTTSTALTLNIGLDRLIVADPSRLEFDTGGTVTSNAPAAAVGISGTLAVYGKISFGSNDFKINLTQPNAVLELGGNITITKDAVGTAATISMPNSISIVGNVTVSSFVTGNISITSTAGSVTIGSDVTAGSKFTGNAKDLTISANTDAYVGNMTSIRDLKVTSVTGDIHLLNSITVTRQINFDTPTALKGVLVHKAFATNATKAVGTSPTPIIITASSTVGQIIVNGTGYSAYLGDGSELQLSAGSATLVNNLNTVNLNRSLTLLKGKYISDGITLTGATANLLIKGTLPVTVSGNIVLNGGRLDNAATLSVSGDITMNVSGALNNLSSGTITMGGAGSDVILAGTASFANSGIFNNASSNVSLVDGSLTNTKTFNAASIVYNGTGSLTNTSTTPMNIGGLVTLAGGSLTNSGTFTAAGAVTLTGAGNLTNNSGSMTVNTLTMGSGNLTSKASFTTSNAGGGAGIIFTGNGSIINSATMKTNLITLNGGGLNNSATIGEKTNGAKIDITGVGGDFINTGTMSTVNNITFTGLGNLSNSLTLTAAGNISLAGGSLTNTGTMIVTGNIALAGAGNLNNTTGSITANAVSLATGNLTNNVVLKTNSIDLGGGNLNNSGTLKERVAGLSHIALVGGGTFTNTGTVSSFNNAVAVSYDTLTLDGANFISGTKTFNVDTLNLLGAGTRNLTISPVGMTVTTLNLTTGNAIMAQGKLTVTGNFNFDAASPSQYFQLGNPVTSVATLTVNGSIANDDLSHFFVTRGNNKVWVKPGAVGTPISFFLNDSTNLATVSQMDINVSTGTSKAIGISTSTPLTTNGKYNGTPVSPAKALVSVARVWNISRTIGEFSSLTVKFNWAASEQGANINNANGQLWNTPATSWSPTNKGGGAGMSGTSYETDILRYSGAYSVSITAPNVAMNDSSYFETKFDELKEKFMDAILGVKEELVEQQMVAEAQIRSAIENTFSQMANRGSLMEKNNLFKTDIDLGLEELLAV